MKTNLLNKPDFLETFQDPMQDVTETATDVIDIWPYVQAVASDDLAEHELAGNELIERVYRDATGLFEHVLVLTKTANVYLVIVVHRGWPGVFGHHLLDLNQEYGVGKS